MASAIKTYNNFLFCSNRGENTIAIYKINADGTLKVLNYESTLGLCPRDFEIFCRGRYIVIANQESDEVLSFKIDYSKGKIELINRIRIEKPVCVAK